jgi:hypothetical protein
LGDIEASAEDGGLDGGFRERMEMVDGDCLGDNRDLD